MSTCTLVAAADGMSTYSLSGSGVQLLTANTTALHVSITTLSPFGGIGNANPANHYHQALLRPGDGTGFWAPVPVEGGPQWIGLPNGTDRIGYACEGGAVISVVEVVGGTSPFAGPPGSPGATGAPGATGPPGPSGSASIASQKVVLSSDYTTSASGSLQDVTGMSLSLAAGTWLLLCTWLPQVINNNGVWCGVLRDGSNTTVYGSSAPSNLSGLNLASCTIIGLAVLTGTTTVKLSIIPAGAGAGNKVLATTSMNGSQINCTQLIAVQIA